MQTVTSFIPRTDSRNIASYRRENSFWKSLSLIDLDAGKEVASVRFYGANAAVYCVAWINGDARGYGKAGGYGYHKPSAAMSEALLRAGVHLDQSIDGVGDGAMIDALEALATFMGIKRPYVHHAHA